MEPKIIISALFEAIAGKPLSFVINLVCPEKNDIRHKISCQSITYTSRGYGCEFYMALIFVKSKALKQAHSWLCNRFSNAAIGKNQRDTKPQY